MSLTTLHSLFSKRKQGTQCSSAKSIFLSAGHPHTLGANPWLSERLPAQQATGSSHPLGGWRELGSAAFSSCAQICSLRMDSWGEGTLQQWSHSTSSHTHHVLLQRESSCPQSIYFAIYNNYPVIPKDLNLCTQVSLSCWSQSLFEAAGLLIPHLICVKSLMLKFSPALQSPIAKMLVEPRTAGWMGWA